MLGESAAPVFLAPCVGVKQAARVLGLPVVLGSGPQVPHVVEGGPLPRETAIEIEAIEQASPAVASQVVHVWMWSPICWLPGAVSGPFWWLDAMLVWFALTNRGAQVRWMMVLPLKAEVVAWLVGLLSLLNLAAYRDVNSAHLVFAWLAAWATTWLDGGSFRRWKLGRRKRAIEKELTKFQVLEGGKDHDRPRRQKPSDYTN